MTAIEISLTADAVENLKAKLDDSDPEDRAVAVILEAVVNVLRTRSARKAMEALAQ